MQVKSIAECSKGQREHSAILWTFIKLPFTIKTFVLSIFKWPLSTGLNVFLSQGGLQKRRDDTDILVLNQYKCCVYAKIRRLL